MINKWQNICAVSISFLENVINSESASVGRKREMSSSVRLLVGYIVWQVQMKLLVRADVHTHNSYSSWEHSRSVWNVSFVPPPPHIVATFILGGTMWVYCCLLALLPVEPHYNALDSENTLAFIQSSFCVFPESRAVIKN